MGSRIACSLNIFHGREKSWSIETVKIHESRSISCNLVGVCLRNSEGVVF